MSAKEPSALGLVVSLAAAGLLSGFVLVGVYLATLPRIERNRAEALAAAVFTVLPGSTETATFVLRDERLAAYDGPAGTLPTEEAVYAGYEPNGKLVGYAIPAEGPGYMDTIKLIFGLDPARKVIVGMAVLESRETPGLGDKILFDEKFLRNFEELAVEPSIVPVKNGTKENPNEVDCITGATISSESVTAILDKGAQRWLPRLEKVDRAAQEGGDGQSGGR